MTTWFDVDMDELSFDASDDSVMEGLIWLSVSDEFPKPVRKEAEGNFRITDLCSGLSED